MAIPTDYWLHLGRFSKEMIHAKQVIYELSNFMLVACGCTGIFGFPLRQKVCMQSSNFQSCFPLSTVNTNEHVLRIAVYTWLVRHKTLLFAYLVSLTAFSDKNFQTKRVDVCASRIFVEQVINEQCSLNTVQNFNWLLTRDIAWNGDFECRGIWTNKKS